MAQPRAVRRSALSLSWGIELQGVRQTNGHLSFEQGFGHRHSFDQFYGLERLAQTAERSRLTSDFFFFCFLFLVFCWRLNLFGYPYLFSSVYNFLHRRLIPLHTYIFNAYTPVSQSFQSTFSTLFESVLLYKTPSYFNSSTQNRTYLWLGSAPESVP